MPKRSRDEEHDSVRSPKRAKARSPSAPADRLSTLSDELLLRVLSFLPIHDLNVCQCLARKYKSIAADSQLWKALYYNRFVRPRASRLPADLQPNHLHYSSKLSKWLDDESLVKKGRETNWKRQYKLRHNWTRGACNVNEIQVAEQPPLPPLLVRMHGSVVYTVDSVGGLRAWSSKKKRGLLAKAELPARSAPTALAIDQTAEESNAAVHRVVVGFENGIFVMYSFDTRTGHLQPGYSHPPSSNGMLSAVAICSPYVVTMTASQLLSLYKFDDPQLLEAPRLLHSLRSHTTWPPLSLAIRPSAQNLVATIAYAIPTFASGWSVGVQEMWLSSDGELLDSRLATSNDDGSRGISASLPSSLSPTRIGSPVPTFAAATPGYSKPTSLSYSHPYLLLSHPDNTLTLYMVTSTDRALSISGGSRLWGHTSSVSGAHVGMRGKAVSVSARGDELRIWELEGTTRRKLASSELSVRVQSPEKLKTVDAVTGLSDAIARRGDGLGLALQNRGMDDMSVVRGWVGFDEENVVLLKEQSSGCQALVVYDFT